MFDWDETQADIENAGRDNKLIMENTAVTHTRSLDGVDGVTETTRRRNGFFQKGPGDKLPIGTLVLYGDMGVENWHTKDVFQTPGQNPKVNSIGLYIVGPEFNHEGCRSFVYFLKLLKRPAAGAPETPATIASRNFFPESFQSQAPAEAVYLSPSAFFEMNKDPLVRAKYDEILKAAENYSASVASPNHHKRAKTSDGGGREEKKGEPKGLFDMPEYYDVKTGASVRSNHSKSLVATNLETTAYCYRLGGPSSMAFQSDRSPNFDIFNRKLNLAAHQESDLLGQQHQVTALIDDTAGTGAVKVTPLSLFDQTRRLGYLQRTLPHLFVTHEISGSTTSTFVEGFLRGDFGKSYTLNDSYGESQEKRYLNHYSTQRKG